MERMKDRKQRMAVSLLAGMVAAVLAAGGPAVKTEGVLAWWGTLYPQFCFSRIQKETEQEKDRRPKTKLSLWLAQALDW